MIKKTIHFTLLFFILLGITISCAEENNKQQKEIIQPVQADIVVEGTTIMYKGAKIDAHSDFNYLKKILGKPSRHYKLTNIYTWDELGILCHIDKKTSQLTSFRVIFSPRKNDFWPKKMYSGNVIIDGATINRTTKEGMFNYKKKGKRFKPGYFSSIFDYDINHVYIRIDLIPTGELLELSLCY